MAADNPTPDESPDASPDEPLDADELLDDLPETPGAGNARAHYAEMFKDMPDDARAVVATKADGLDLRALCYDPLPKVIYAVLHNANCTVEHARLIAKEHRSGVGLGHLIQKAAYMRDQEVHRQLLRNPLAGPQVIQKLIGNRPLLHIYRTAIDRNVPQNTREFARATLRKAWNMRESDEKLALLVKTEARCCALLIGQSLDGKAAAALCGRSAMSTMMIRNLARWPSTPPPVLQHMFRLPAVGRDKNLKQLIQRHPNAPSSLKRA